MFYIKDFDRKLFYRCIKYVFILTVAKKTAHKRRARKNFIFLTRTKTCCAKAKHNISRHILLLIFQDGSQNRIKAETFFDFEPVFNKSFK